MTMLFTGIYLLAMMAAGWRLFGMTWTPALKALAAIGLVAPIPLLILLPALLHPERPFANMERWIGGTLLVCGALGFCGGVALAWMRARRK